MPDVAGDRSEEEYNSELKELRENAKNLGECLHALLRRIEELEHTKTAVQVEEQQLQHQQQQKGNRAPLLVNLGKPTSFEAIDPNSRNVHVETQEIVGDDGTTTRITKRTQVTERVLSTRTYGGALASPCSDHSGAPEDTWKMGSNHDLSLQPIVVGFRSKKSTPDHLGLIVREEQGQLVVEQIDEKSPLIKQGLVHVGDSILEVNGHEVRTKADLEKQVKQSGEGISIKVVPSRFHEAPVDAVYYRTLFDYEPFKDEQIPSKAIGLAFRNGDVVQVINKEDTQWWQARKVNDLSRVGLVPSDKLEEKRNPLATSNGKKKKKGDQSPRTGTVYQEVGKLSPYGRRALILLGAPGVGRRTLKSMLLAYDRANFATVTPYTSRPKRSGEQEGREYYFVKREDMKKEIDKGNYVEWGEYGQNTYGTTVQSVRAVVRSGRMCVLDCSPQAARYLYTREFMPYIVFLAPPPFEEMKQLYQLHPNRSKNKTEADMQKTCDDSAQMESQYQHLFDLVLCNRNADVTFRRLLDALDSLKSETQWVPVDWLH